MKIIAVILAIFGATALYAAFYAEGGSIVVVLVIALAFMLGGYKLWKAPKKPKKTKKSETITVEKKPYNPYMDMSVFESEQLLEPIEYEDLFLKKDEAVYFAIPARFLKQSKNNNGKIIKTVGDYVLTNQRVVFIADSENFEIALDKLTAVRIERDNSITLLYGQKNYNLLIGDYKNGVPYLEAEYTHLATTEVVKRFASHK